MSRPVTLAAIALCVTALSACGTGLQAQTYKESGRQDGASVTLDDMAVRNLHVTPPLTGSTIGTADSAVLAGVLVNGGTTDDALVSASSDVAATAVLEEGGQPTTRVPVPARASSTSSWSIVLSGLSRDLHAGTFITVTLVFEKARSVTVQVPVRAGDNGLGDRQPLQDPYHEA